MRLILALTIALALAGCANIGGYVGIGTYDAKLAFDGAVKSFNAYKRLCVAKAIPSGCRAYVAKGQGIIRQAYAYEKAANDPALQAAIAELVAVVTSLENLR